MEVVLVVVLELVAELFEELFRAPLLLDEAPEIELELEAEPDVVD